jgi:ATP-binding cassette, subfamily B, bacterial
VDAELRRAFAYLQPYWRRLTLVFAISVVSTATTLAVPYLTKDLIDTALIGRDTAALRRIVSWFAALGVFSFVLNVVSGLRYTRVSADILFDMRLALYQHLQRLSPRFFARTRLGDIIARINGDISEIQRVAAEAALAWVGNVLFLVGSLGMMMWLDWQLTAVALALMPLSLWALVHYRRRLENRVGELRQRSADIGSFLIETLQANTLVVAANAQARETSRFRRLNDAFVNAVMGMQRITYFAGGLPGMLLSIGAAIVFLYGGSRVIDGTLTLGTFGAFLAYQMRVFAPAQALMGLYASLATARVSWRRVLELLDATVEVNESAEAVATADVRGEMSFADVSLRTDRGLLVLDRVSFTVRPGESLAIVGASGSGKSTLAFLAARLLDPDAGSVSLDGHDLRTMRLADVRRHVVLVEQEPMLLHGTIAENIRYVRPEAGDDEVQRAARAAGIASFIEALPDQYRTVVGERGLALSAGERQRVAIARAFLADPIVLVLDEPTAALDPVSERHVTEGYEMVMRGRTTVLISHRRDLAERADRVVVLEGASVVETGTPRELAARGGAFARLFALDNPLQAAAVSSANASNQRRGVTE